MSLLGGSLASIHGSPSRMTRHSSPLTASNVPNPGNGNSALNQAKEGNLTNLEIHPNINDASGIKTNGRRKGRDAK